MTRWACCLVLLSCGRTGLFSYGERGVDAGTGAQHFAVVTDSFWKTQGSQPPAGWLDAGFDDSAWPAAFVLSDPLADDFPGGMWDGPSITSGSRQVWFRRSFQLARPVTDVRLFAQCNDDMTVWLNGELVIQEQDGVTTLRRLSNVAQTVVGENVLAAACRDVIPPEHGLSIGLWGRSL